MFRALSSRGPRGGRALTLLDLNPPAYDVLGRKTNEVNPGQTTNRFAYTGGGDLRTLTDGKGQVTSWGYDAYGRPITKTNAASAKVLTWAYDAAGRLTNRWSAAKGTTAYAYDRVGNLTNVNYPASADVALAFDALGRLTNEVVAGVLTNRYTYHANGQIGSEDGPWADDTVSYSYNNGLRSGLSLLQPGAGAWAQNLFYDAAKRLETVNSPAGQFGYQYLVGTGSTPSLISRLSLPGGSYITNTYDAVARLLATQLRGAGNAVLNAHSYALNLAGQRTRQTRWDGSYLDYTYDGLGELLTAKGKESGGSSRLQEQLSYGYDPAGNLSKRTNNAHVQTFAVNVKNELTTATRSGTLTAAGNTTTPATSVTVNGLPATRYADKTFSKDGFSLSDGTNTFTAIAEDGWGRKDTNTVAVFLPATVTFTYDSNGNLTSDGRRGFDYDDENQLIRVTVANSWKSEFTYDGRMRLRVRKEYVWSASSWVLASEFHYLYDGALVLQERNGNNQPLVTYTRGIDCSGSLQGAGGIGGLLARADHATGQSAYYHADGNGNVTALVNGAPAIVARYTYDPYGNLLAKAGALADANLYRFSSKETHTSSGLIYYGRRFYEPNLQRWMNQDPLGEFPDGPNLYSYVRNNPVSGTDPMGLWNLWNPATWGVRGSYSVWNSLNPFGSSASWNGYSWDRLGQSAQATLDGIIPFSDPFLEGGGYSRCDRSLAWSRFFGAFARDAYLVARIPNIAEWARSSFLYETGSLTVPADVFELMEGLNAIQKGEYLISNFGLASYLLPVEAASTGQFAITIWTGLTPAAWLSLGAGAQVVDTWPEIPGVIYNWYIGKPVDQEEAQPSATGHEE